PDMHALFPKLIPPPTLAPSKYPQLLDPNTVNFSDGLKTAYINHISPAARKPHVADRGEQYGNYSSTAPNDVACLQAFSQRLFFGKFALETKFMAEQEKFTDPIQRG